MKDTDINQIIINKLKKATFDSIVDKDPTQLYFVTDEDYYLTSDLTVSIASKENKIITATELNDVSAALTERINNHIVFRTWTEE